jgi:hypothetical protein
MNIQQNLDDSSHIFILCYYFDTFGQNWGQFLCKILYLAVVLHVTSKMYMSTAGTVTGTVKFQQND